MCPCWLLGVDNPHFCCVDAIDSTLSRFLANRKAPLEVEYVQYFSYQLVKALWFLHSGGVTHGDLRPSRVLLSTEMEVKVAFCIAVEADQYFMPISYLALAVLLKRIARMYLFYKNNV